MARDASCSVDDYYPLLTITQGNIVSRTLGLAVVDGTAAKYFFPAPAGAPSNMAPGEASAELAVTVYFQCVRDLYGTPQFRPSDRNLSRDLLNTVVYRANASVIGRPAASVGVATDNSCLLYTTDAADEATIV
jgi:hypothetical protein